MSLEQMAREAAEKAVVIELGYEVGVVYRLIRFGDRLERFYFALDQAESAARKMRDQILPSFEELARNVARAERKEAIQPCYQSGEDVEINVPGEATAQKATTWTHNVPHEIGPLVERLRSCDGVNADAAVITWEQCGVLVAQFDRLEKICKERPWHRDGRGPDVPVSQERYDALRDTSGVSERDRLLDAIKAHHAQKADDRCVEDDDRLYEAAGLPPCDRRVGDKFAMIQNCARFIESRCEGGGPWKSYAEMEAENARMRDAVTLTLAGLQPLGEAWLMSLEGWARLRKVVEG
jgi:hypothetical protein